MAYYAILPDESQLTKKKLCPVAFSLVSKLDSFQFSKIPHQMQ